MPEQANKVRSVYPDQEAILSPIGERVIGKVDPRTLSREAFEASADLLFHGAAKQLIYSTSFDYSSAEYFAQADGSQTLGRGFYVTDVQDVAENYSRVRQGRDEASPYVISLLPYQAKVLDLRASDNVSINVPVSGDIFEKWFQFYKSYFFNKEGRQNQPWNVALIESDYFQFLVRAKKLDKPLDLRVMLDTAPYPELQGHNYPHPPYVKLFSSFMRQEGFDGLIYNEGGEGKDRKSHSTYIFFNLDKIGTYDSWQTSETHLGNMPIEDITE